MEFRAYTLAELESDPVISEQRSFFARCLDTPLGLIEKVRRPHAGISAFDLDEVDEQDLCAAFARDIAAIASLGTVSAGILVNEKQLGQLPHVPAVYWLNAPLDSECRSWRLVYVGRAADLNHRWNNQEHHRFALATAWNCRLDWWEVNRGTEALIEAAMIYHLKPAWNERQ